MIGYTYTEIHIIIDEQFATLLSEHNLKQKKNDYTHIGCVDPINMLKLTSIISSNAYIRFWQVGTYL